MISANIWLADKLLSADVLKLLMDAVLMAAICAVDMTAICALVSADISSDVLTAISAVDSALILLRLLPEMPVIGVAMDCPVVLGKFQYLF